MTYTEGSMLAKATATIISSSFGAAFDNTLPKMSECAVDPTQLKFQLSDSEPDPIGLIQMIRRTDLKFAW